MEKEIEIFWVTEDGVIEYKKEFSEEIYNFLFWEGDEKKPSLLIAGNGLYAGGASHTSLLLQFIEKNEIPDKGIPDGAGNRPGKLNLGISGWKSVGLGINTPTQLREVIGEALGLNYFS